MSRRSQPRVSSVRVRGRCDEQVGEIAKETGRAVRLRVACELLGISVRTGERLVALGLFPVPELPRRTPRRGSPHLFSTADIARYLDSAATEWVR